MRPHHKLYSQLRNTAALCTSRYQHTQSSFQCQVKPNSQRTLQVSAKSFPSTVRHSSYQAGDPSASPSAIHNVQSIVGKWTDYFRDKRISEPEASAELIVANVLGLKTLEGVAPWQIVPIEKTDKINKLCSLRLKRMPVQYVIEEWDFRDLVLQMKPPVLIPRPETEEMITHIKNYYNIHDLPAPDKILDIGCGSGALALALAKEFPLSQCVAVDQCHVACEMTSKNANNHSLAHVHVENVAFNDETVAGHDCFSTEYDLIVSNPPYLKTSELRQLAPEIRKYEDLKALDGGEDGLNMVKAIIRNAKKFMRKSSLLCLEVAPQHPNEVKQLVAENQNWELNYVKTYKDFNDRPRFCLLSKSA